MHRFYCEQKNIVDRQIFLTGMDVNHIRNVLRMKRGEDLVICDGHGKDYYCRINSLDAAQIIVDIDEEKPSESELPVRITLYQGLPKKEKMELIVQKTVELGVAEIVPVAMKRCVVKLEDEKKESKKRERWQLISESAAKQSGRGVIPEVTKALSYKEALKRAAERGMIIVPYEHAAGMNALKQAVTELTASLGKDRKEISVFIGPEGGFEESEMEHALTFGAVSVSLGKRILRTETAGLATLSILMYEIECATEKGTY